MSADVALTRKDHIDELVRAGDFCFVLGRDGHRHAVMACPACALVFYCPHTVVQEEPITLFPSVVGPATPNPAEWHARVMGPCEHHFWVKDGKALGVV